MFNEGDLIKFYEIETDEYLSELEVVYCEDVPKAEGAFICHFKAVDPWPLKEPDESLDYSIRDPVGKVYTATFDPGASSLTTWAFRILP